MSLCDVYVLMNLYVICMYVCMSLCDLCLCAWACVVYVCVHEPMWCMYVCMSLCVICMCKWACVLCVCVHEPVETRDRHWMSSYLLFTLFFETRPLTSPRTWYSVVQTSPASFSSISPCSGVTAVSHHGIWLKSSCLHTKPSQQPRNDYDIVNIHEYRFQAVCHAPHMPVTWAFGR